MIEKPILTRKLTRRDVSEIFQLSLRTVDYFVSTHQIPFSRLGKRGVRFDEAKLQKWFNEREGVEFRHKKRTE